MNSNKELELSSAYTHTAWVKSIPEADAILLKDSPFLRVRDSNTSMFQEAPPCLRQTGSGSSSSSSTLHEPASNLLHRSSGNGRIGPQDHYAPVLRSQISTPMLQGPSVVQQHAQVGDRGCDNQSYESSVFRRCQQAAWRSSDQKIHDNSLFQRYQRASASSSCCTSQLEEQVLHACTQSGVDMLQEGSTSHTHDSSMSMRSKTSLPSLQSMSSGESANPLKTMRLRARLAALEKANATALGGSPPLMAALDKANATAPGGTSPLMAVLDEANATAPGGTGVVGGPLATKPQGQDLGHEMCDKESSSHGRASSGPLKVLEGLTEHSSASPTVPRFSQHHRSCLGAPCTPTKTRKPGAKVCPQNSHSSSCGQCNASHASPPSLQQYARSDTSLSAVQEQGCGSMCHRNPSHKPLVARRLHNTTPDRQLQQRMQVRSAQLPPAYPRCCKTTEDMSELWVLRMPTPFQAFADVPLEETWLLELMLQLQRTPCTVQQSITPPKRQSPILPAMPSEDISCKQSYGDEAGFSNLQRCNLNEYFTQDVHMVSPNMDTAEHRDVLQNLSVNTLEDRLKDQVRAPSKVQNMAWIAPSVAPCQLLASSPVTIKGSELDPNTFPKSFTKPSCPLEVVAEESSSRRVSLTGLINALKHISCFSPPEPMS